MPEKSRKLNPGERSVLGYFPSSSKAKKALEKLKSMGFEIAQMDRVSRYEIIYDDEYNSPLSGDPSQTSLTLYSSDNKNADNPSTRVLLGADPSVSGMASRNYGMAGNYPFMVTVVAREENATEVARIIEEHDGYV